MQKNFIKENDVLVVGELNIDIILDKIDGLPTVGKEILAKKFTFTLGSSSAIFASNLQTLGATVSYVGKIGQDQFGEVIKDALLEKQVDTRFILETKKHATGSSVILNYDMDRAIVTYPGAMEHMKIEEVSNDMLRSTKHMHVSSIFLQTEIKKEVVQLFKRAKTLGITTSLDPQWDPAELWDLDLQALLPYVDVFLPNKTEFLAITGCQNIKEAIDTVSSYANTIVIKDGENGSHLWHDNKISSKPAYLNSAVEDCIGAGDSFDAGFIRQYVKQKNLEVCAEYGNIMGAVNTTKPGGTTAFTSLKDVLSIAKNKFDIGLS